MFTKKSKLIRKRTLVIAGAIGIVCAAALTVGLYFGLRPTENESANPTSTTTESSSSPGRPEFNPSELGVYDYGAVTTNGYPCAKIGRDILLKNGSAVEAAIAALFCEGVVCLQSMGLGGGFLMTIYERKTKKVRVLNAREVAPRAANETMFHSNESISQSGGLAVAVPGELRGYWRAYEEYKSGNVEWGDLIQPTIELCRNGITVTAYTAAKFKEKEEVIKNSPTLREILVNNETNSVWKEGDTYKRLKLAEFLEIIKEQKADALYNGSLTEAFVKDIQELGGIITKEDMAEYEPKWSEPVRATLKDNVTMYTVPLPGSGVLLTLMINILNGFVPTNDSITNYQRIIEAFKYGYGKRTQLGDPNYVNIDELLKQLTSESYADSIRRNISDHSTSQDPAYYGAEWILPEDSGTAHVSVLAPNGDAVSVTSTINLVLGAKVRSTSTGIILNDEMDDFSAPNITNGFGMPPSPNNFIVPGKQPLSSMVPSIFVDGNGDVKLVAGAAGGTKITTATALIAMDVLWFNKTVEEAINAKRFHHQLFPMHFQYEDGFSQEIVNGLEAIGHVSKKVSSAGSSVTAISKINGKIHAGYDFRRGGATAGL